MAASSVKPIRVGLLGFGTVGSGVAEILESNAEEIERRAGRRIEVARVAVRDLAKPREHVGPQVTVTDDPYSIVLDPGIDIVCELIGGTDIARDLVTEAIAQGKSVITANKALLAVHGNVVFAAAIERGVMVAFEAAVAGGIPIIKALREGLTGNRIEWFAGIINGTTNYILSEMRDKGLTFAAALAEAQALGYAEADPTFDIEGIDAAHKATLLAAIAFGVPVQFERAYVEGISQLAAEDIAYAERLGYRIKLLGIGRRRPGGDIELRVHPTLVPEKRLIANVEGPMNAVMVMGDFVGQTLYYGKGAGKQATASAVVADLVDVTRMMTSDPQNRVPHLAFQPGKLVDSPIVSSGEFETAFYLRMRVADEPGVLADITRILADAAVSIDALLQREPAAGESSTDIILLTHRTIEHRIDRAIARIEALSTVLSKVVRIRLEDLV